MKNLFSLFLLIVIGNVSVYAKPTNAKVSKAEYFYMNDCLRPTRQIDVAANNVRLRLTNDGCFLGATEVTMTFPSIQLQNNPSVLYGSGIWLGGIDQAGNVKVSASTYETSGNDFFSGPLDVNGSTDLENCDRWNKIFTVKSASIEKQIKLFQKSLADGKAIDCNSIPRDVKLWPAKGNTFFKDTFGWSLPVQNLASFWDMDDNGEYDPCKGDYPYLHSKGSTIGYHEGKIIPSEINYFIINDNGNTQTLTGVSSMQLEMHLHTFVYSSNDEINDMSFYQFKLINKSAIDYNSFYTSLWVDPDLGCYDDDYLGSVPDINMGFVYNQDKIDGLGEVFCNGVLSYKDSIPALAFGMLEAPMVGKIFKKDNSGNILYDQNGNKILLDLPFNAPKQDTIVEGGLTTLNYMTNGAGVSSSQFDPSRGSENQFYQLMRGFWRDGTPVTYGGNGLNIGSTDTVKYAFPDNPNDPTGWSMCSANIPGNDIRMLMTTGQLVFKAGAQNNFTYYFAPTFDVVYPCPDISKLKFSDSLVKNLFNDGFEHNLIGPDAPDISSVVDDQKITMSLSNDEYSNNKNESFVNTIIGLPSGVDNKYVFEGYKVYQLKNKNVRYDQLSNYSFARLAAQSDINNNLSNITNWRFGKNPDTLSSIPIIWKPLNMVTAANQGLQTTFNITNDLFSPTNEKLVNGKQYFYVAVAYAYNNWKPFDINTSQGQTKSYLEGVRNFKVYTIIPNKTSSTNNEIASKVTILNNPSISVSKTTLTMTGLDADDQFEIYNIQGHKLASLKFENAISNEITGFGLSTVTFDLSDINLSSGLHFIRFKNKKNPTLRWVVL